MTGIILTTLIVSFQSIMFTGIFDNHTNTSTLSPASGWKTDSNYYISSSNVIRKSVSNLTGKSNGLTTPVFIASSLSSGEIILIELTDLLPIIQTRKRNTKILVNIQIDNIISDDILSYHYVSGEQGLLVDEDFSSRIPVAFRLKKLNTSHKMASYSTRYKNKYSYKASV
jgi:hypothetical protein